MHGVFPIAVPQFGDAINQPGQHTKRYRRVLDIPCETRTCLINFPPDVEIYNLQDALIFSDALSFIVTCPAGRVCPPGYYPRVVTFPPGTFIVPDPRVNPGFPITIQLTGCQSTVSRTLPATATILEINAAAQEVIQEVARQQAECDSVVDPPIPNPGPFFTNVETYSAFPCGECEGAVFDGSLPWYISLDQENGRLVFATGVIAAATQALADAEAQTFLDDFKSNAIANGKLTCIACTIDTASPLPSGSVGVAYSQTITASDTVETPVWSVVDGALPDGLSLNSATGEISGSPTTEETATFTIKSTAGVQCCEKEFELEIGPEGCPDWDELSWGQASIVQIGGTGTFSPPQFTQQANAEANLSIDNNPASFVNVGAFGPATIIHNGPLCACNYRIEINRVGPPNVGFDTAGVIVTSSLFGILLNTVVMADGITDLPFNLPDTLGADDTIEVLALSTLDNIVPGSGAVRSMQVLFQLSNV